MKMKKLAISITAIVGGNLFAFSPIAMAQEAANTESNAQNGKEESVEVIMVSASRRIERLQDVPIAVSALTGDQLEASTFKDIKDIAYTFSGVQYGESPNDQGFRVRGVGVMGGYSSASEAPVGVVVDGVVMGIGSPMESIGDIVRVEVLKGPQGTQFGKNASSGVVSITTAKPDLFGVSGNVYGSYASLNEHDLHGSVNVPLADNTAMSIYVFDKEHDGFIDNVVLDQRWGGQHKSGTRIKLLSEPSDNLTLYWIGDYAKSETTGPGQTWTINKLVAGATNPFSPFGTPFVDLDALGVTPSDENNKSIENTPSEFSDENYGMSLQADYEFGSYMLSSITAWREFNTGARTFAIDGAPYTKFQGTNTGGIDRLYSQEFRLVSPSGEDLEYIAGLYFSRQETGLGEFESATLSPAQPYDSFPTISITNGYTHTETQSDSAAIFVDGKYHINEQLSLVGGLRLTKDKVEALTYSKIDEDLPAFDPVNHTGVLPYGPREEDADNLSKTDVSGRIGFQYVASRDLMVYGTLARGYLGPTVTFSGLTGSKSKVAPQTVNDVTVGIKSQFLEQTMTFNANVFFDKYTDLQTSVFDGVEFLTENAGGAETKGLEFDLGYKATEDLNLNLSYTYSDAVFTDYITDCPTPIVLAGTQATACNATGSTDTTFLYQAEGEPLPGAPKHTVIANASYIKEMGSEFLLDVNANASYRSDVQNSVGNEDTIQKAYTIVNLTAGISNSDDTWRVGLFARNLFDQNYNSAIIGLPFADAGSYVNWRVRNAERTIGAEVSYKF